MAMVGIPLSTGAHKFTIRLGESRYRFTFIYRKAVWGGWFLDVENLSTGKSVYGIPLLLGRDLLSQYQHLGFGHLYVELEGEQGREPTYNDMGKVINLYWSDDE